MHSVIQELLTAIKEGFVACDENEIILWKEKRILVIASAGINVMDQLVKKFLLPSHARLSISGTIMCRQYIEKNCLQGVDYFFHEGRYMVDSQEYRIFQNIEFDILIYLVTQKDLYNYINIEELCQDYCKSHTANVYCADTMGNLWKNINLEKYVAAKKAYKNLIDYICNKS